MSDLIQFPFLRKQYASINNPGFISDWVAANQSLLSGLAAIAGIGSTDFYIFSGFAYTAGSPGTYGPGIFFLNGNFYYQSTTFNENLRLIPNVTDIMPVSFPSDSVTRDIYTVNYSQTGTGGTQTPLFATGGNMDKYRMDLKTMLNNVLPTVLLNEQQSALGSGYQVAFTNDKAVFFAAAAANATITFDMTNARPGVVVTLKWTFSGAQTLALTAPGGGNLIREGGDLGLAANNTNVLNIMYAGINESGSKEIRYVFNQSL